MDWVRRAIDTGELTPEQIGHIREAIGSVLHEEGQPTRDDAGSGSRRRVR